MTKVGTIPRVGDYFTRYGEDPIVWVGPPAEQGIRLIRMCYKTALGTTDEWEKLYNPQRDYTHLKISKKNTIKSFYEQVSAGR